MKTLDLVIIIFNFSMVFWHFTLIVAKERGNKPCLSNLSAIVIHLFAILIIAIN